MNVSYVVEVCLSDLDHQHATHLVTCQAFQSISVLPLEEVHDETVISHSIDLPFLLRRNFRWESFQCSLALGRHLNSRRFDFDTVQILVQTVQYKREEFL